MNRPEVLALLRALGETKEAVAASLLAAGAKGVPQNPCNCPLANYLALHDVRTAAVYMGVARVFVGGFWDLLSLPRAVERFRAAFDGGDFAELRRT